MSKTITRTDLTNILNKVLPAGGGGGGLTYIPNISVTAEYNGSLNYWTLSLDDYSVLDGYIPVVASLSGGIGTFPFTFDMFFFCLPDYISDVMGFEDNEQYDIDVWCIDAPV